MSTESGFTATRVKVSDLSGPALDWAVAKCEGVYGELIGRVFHKDTGWDWIAYSPSTDWSLAGPIIEREGVELCYRGFWQASVCFDNDSVAVYAGPTPLIAAMRCYVASKFGDTIEIPEELL